MGGCGRSMVAPAARRRQWRKRFARLTASAAGLCYTRGRSFRAVSAPSCFPGEDLMGRIAKLGKACARKSVFRRTMQRYLLLRCSRWRKERMAAASPAS